LACSILFGGTGVAIDNRPSCAHSPGYDMPSLSIHITEQSSCLNLRQLHRKSVDDR